MKYLLIMLMFVISSISQATQSGLSSFSGEIPKYQIGAGAGWYDVYPRYGHNVGLAKMYSLSVERQISRKWAIGLQHQLGIHRESVAIENKYNNYPWLKNGRCTFKDISAALTLSRCFLKNGALKVTAGIGYLFYEDIDNVYVDMSNAWDINVPYMTFYNKVYRGAMMIPLSIDYRVCKLRNMSINITAGTFYEKRYVFFFERYYLAPALRIKI